MAGPIVGAALDLAGSDVFVRHPSVEVHCLPDQSVLLFSKASETAFPLSESAALIWEMCDGSCTVDQIIEALLDRYDATPADAARDTRSFIDVLVRHDLVARQSLPQ